MSAPGPARIRRVLVPCDLSDASLAALEAAVALAARLGAELAGLFIEDVELLRLASRASARALDARTAEALPVSGPAMERELRALGQRARQALEERAMRSGLAWTFRVVRSRVTAAVLEAAGAVDLVVLGRAGSASPRGADLGSTARAMALAPPNAVLLLGADVPLGPPVVLVHDGGEAADRALDLALALVPDARLCVLALPAALADGGARLAARAPLARVRPLPEGARLAQAVDAEQAGLLVLPAGAGDGALSLVRSVRCPVLLVR